MEAIIYESKRTSGSRTKGFFHWFSETERPGYSPVVVTVQNYKLFELKKFIKSEYGKSRTAKFGRDCDFYKNFVKYLNER